MASFTDSIPQFNPYIQQLPVEEMVQVGMEKQRRYDEGITKIQSQIDSVAGLDLMKGVHKDYLQSKLNSLGNNLKMVAAGDFSNYQLVNSVSGMTGQIVKDPIIQGAVASTAKARAELANIQAAQKSGKSSPENEAFFNNQLSGWLGDGDLNTRFNNEFIEYTDVDKKLRDIAEKVHEYDNSIDMPFKRDAAGNTIRGKDGKPLVDEAMLRIKTKGKSAEKILNNFYDNLDENDKRQLGITGWYHYRGATKETFKKDIVNNFSDRKQLIKNEIVDLNLELKTNPKLSSSEKSKIQADINNYNTKLTNGSLDAEMNKQISEIDSITNLDDYKYKLYTQNHLTNLAKDMSYQSIQQSFEANPYEQADNRRRELQFKYDNARREQRNTDRDFAFKVARAGVEDYRWQFEHGLDASGRPIGEAEAIAPGGEAPTIAGIEQDISDIAGAPGKPGQIDILNSTYGPMLTDKTLTTPEQKKAYLDGLAKQYRTDPSTINSIKDPNVREYLEQRRELDNKLAQKQNLYNATVAASKQFDDKLDNALATEKSIVANGKTLYTAKELFEVAQAAEKFQKTTRVGVDEFGRGQNLTEFDADNFLKRYKGTKYETIAAAYYKKNKGLQLSPGEQVIYNNAVNVNYKYKPVQGQVAQDKLAFQSDFLSKRMPESQATRFTISNDNKGDMNRINQLIGNSIVEYGKGGVGGLQIQGKYAPKEINFSTETIAKLKADKDASYTVRKNPDGTGELLITGKDGSQNIPMTAAQFSAYFPSYATINPITNIKTAIIGSVNYTTNALDETGDNPSHAVNAHFSGYDLPQLRGSKYASLVRLDVEGSPLNNGGINDRFSVRMYVNDNGNWKTDNLNQEGYVNDAGLQQILNSIGESTVEDLLRQNR